MHPRAKLTPDAVLAIRENRYGKSYRQLAEAFKVHPNTVKRIAWGHTWKHVELR